jgi:hypothetical protein
MRTKGRGGRRTRCVCSHNPSHYVTWRGFAQTVAAYSLHPKAMPGNAGGNNQHERFRLWRITPRPNKRGKPKPNEAARLIRLTCYVTWRVFACAHGLSWRLQAGYGKRSAGYIRRNTANAASDLRVNHKYCKQQIGCSLDISEK